MIKHVFIEKYIKQYKKKEILLNKERQLLIDYLESEILPRDDLHFNNDLIDKCVRFIEKWHFELEPFQKFLIAFVFLYDENDDVFFDQHFWMMARGAGKNGLISGLTHFLISELHGIEGYNVSVVANTEKQSKMSFNDVYNANKKHPTLDKKFDSTKLLITNKRTMSTFQFHTSKAGSKDSLRDGAVIYDEIHRWEDGEIPEVFSSGLGKVPHSREFFITTDGFVREGYLDQMKDRAMNILTGKEKEDRLFPFICKLDELEEADKPDVWEKANPMFAEPRSRYGRDLFRKVHRQWKDLENNPSNRESFLTKRMNWPEVDLEKSVASWDDIMATNRKMPDLTHETCVGAVDFASIRDFAACGLLFKNGEDYIFKTHSFVRKGFIDEEKPKAPLYEWQEDGLLTILDEPVINVQHIVDWFVDMREQYGLNRIVADTFRLDLVKTALEDEGFEVVYIRNPNAASAKMAPRIETVFSNHNLIFGDNKLMRWYTNNVLVQVKKDGNKHYEKKEPRLRKTDGFMAFLYALWEADNVLEQDEDFFLDEIVF